MSELIYPTSTKIRGPILIDATFLTELDAIVAEHRNVIRALRDQTVEQKVAQRMAADSQQNARPEDVVRNRKLYTELALIDVGRRDSLRLTVRLSNGASLRATSFEEVAAHAEVSKNAVADFNLNLDCSDVSMEMSAESNSFSTELTLRVSPSNSDVSRNLFSALSRWMRKIQAPRWQQWWCSAGHLRGGIWIVFFCVAITVWAGMQGGMDTRYYKAQGRELLRQGLTAANQQKAVEVLLAITTDYSAPIEHRMGNWFWFFLIGGAAMCLIVGYPPRLVIGLGVGEDHIRRWRMWTRFVFIVVPGFIAANFLWPYLVNAIKKIPF